MNKYYIVIYLKTKQKLIKITKAHNNITKIKMKTQNMKIKTN